MYVNWKESIVFDGGKVVLIWEDGVHSEWWCNNNGYAHRDNGLPAYVCDSGDESYYENGGVVMREHKQ